MKDHPVYFILYSIIPSYSSNKYLILAFVFFSLTILYTQCVPMYTGMQVFYAESLTTFVVDLNRCEPTLFLSVPRLWTKFQGGVLSKLPASKLDFILKIPLINILIKKKVRTPNYCLYYFITIVSFAIYLFISSRHIFHTTIFKFCVSFNLFKDPQIAWLA
jgi:hypothetical protein